MRSEAPGARPNPPGARSRRPPLVVRRASRRRRQLRRFARKAGTMAAAELSSVQTDGVPSSRLRVRGRRGRRPGRDCAQRTLRALPQPDGRLPLRQELHEHGLVAGSVLLRTTCATDRRRTGRSRPHAWLSSKAAVGVSSSSASTGSSFRGKAGPRVGPSQPPTVIDDARREIGDKRNSCLVRVETCLYARAGTRGRSRARGSFCPEGVVSRMDLPARCRSSRKGGVTRGRWSSSQASAR
jgi:hypothetical protein